MMRYFNFCKIFVVVVIVVVLIVEVCCCYCWGLMLYLFIYLFIYCCCCCCLSKVVSFIIFKNMDIIKIIWYIQWHICWEGVTIFTLLILLYMRMISVVHVFVYKNFIIYDDDFLLFTYLCIRINFIILISHHINHILTWKQKSNALL